MYYYLFSEFLTVLGEPDGSYHGTQKFSTGHLATDRAAALAYALEREAGILKRGHFRGRALVPPGATSGATYSVAVELIEQYRGLTFGHSVYGDTPDAINETRELEIQLGALPNPQHN